MSEAENMLLQKIKKYQDPDSSNLLIAFPFDLSEKDLCRIDGVVAVSEDSVKVYENGVIKFSESMSNILSLEAESGVGSVSVIVKTKSGESLLCRSSATHKKAIAAAVKKANHYIKFDTLPDSRFERTERVCPKCKKPYAMGSNTCFSCTNKWEIAKRLFAVAKGYKRYIYLSVVLFLAVTAISLITPSINRVMVDNYIQAEQPTSLSGFAVVIASLVVLQVVQRLLQALRGRCLIFSGNKVIYRLRQMVFEKVSRLSLSTIQEYTAGQLMNRVTEDTNRIQSFITDDLASMLEQVITIMTVALILLTFDWKLALMVLLPTPIVCISFRLFWKFLHNMFHIRWELNSKASAILHDIFSGIRVVKSYGTEQRETERYNSITSDEMTAQIRQEKAWAVIMPILQFFMSFGEFVLLYYVGSKILGGEMTLGQMSQFSAYVSMIYGPLRMLARLPNRLAMVITSIVKVFDLIDEEERITDAANPVDADISGNIKFENVSFGYEDAKEVLRDINLEIKAGEFIGLVGRSGAGKSTLINLIMRLYDAETGAVLIDGVDIREISQDTLRKNIGVVLQDTFLFSGTVFDNIAFAKPEATREEIIEVAKAAGAHSFIMRLPDGYDTYIGERGYTLSGGERQRVSIARALLRKPKILILDEATSALDTETEKIIQDAIELLSKNCTTIAIAHRLSTLRNASRLVVLDHGRVVETGTHDELMTKGGKYKELVLAQREMTRMPALNAVGAPPPHPRGHQGPPPMR